MGYRIEVNHSALRSAAGEIRSYARSCSSDAVHTAQISEQLSLGWQGLDAKEVNNKLKTVDDRKSTLMITVQTLNDFADYLEGAADSYSKTQADAINRSLWL